MALLRNLFVAAVVAGVTSVAFGARPSVAVLQTCARGKSTDSVHVEPIDFTAMSVAEHYWHGQDASLTEHNGIQIGYVGEGLQQGLIYARHVFSVAQASPMNVPVATYREWLKRGVLDLSQPADWFEIREDQTGAYLCVALNRSMSRSTPLLFVLPLSKRAQRLYFAEQR